MICPHCVAMVLMKILPALPWVVIVGHWIFNRFKKVKCKKNNFYKK